MDASEINETTGLNAQAESGSPVTPAPGQGDTQKILFLLVIALFAISGFSSLVYQVLWTRMLVFVFGSTTFASSTVLAVFMGGLALGAYAAGRISDRLARPFLWYGILEGVIGLWALLAPFMFDAAIPLYKLVWQTFHVSVLPFSIFRFGVATCILLVPTTCMGATLPLLSRFVTLSLSKVGDRVGTLYAVNTLGAVGGALTAGFCLLPALGLNLTTYVAVALNLLLMVMVLVASRHYESGKLMELHQLPAGDETKNSPVSSKLPLQVVAAMIAFGCSGGVAMIYEVAWTRTLLMVIGSSTYAFTVMLSTFLIGIFLGSLVCARFVDKLKQPMAWFALAQFLLCTGGLLSIYLFNFVPYWNMSINASLAGNPNAALSVRFLLAACVLLPITLCLGAIFPLVVKVCTGALESVGRSVGTLYSANTLGAIIGAFLAGFVIIPSIGVEHALIWASMANLLIACALLFFLAIPQRLKLLCGAAGILCLVLAAKQDTIWDQLMLMSAQTERRFFVYSNGAVQLPPIDEWRRELHESRKLAFVEDGACATVGILQFPGSRSLLTNGHVDASDGNDMRNQILIGAYPMLFNTKAGDVAVVGWGSGVSLGMSSVFPSAKKVIGIEIEPAVLKAAKFFDHVNFVPDKNPKVDIEINDGRNYLLATNDKFDAIISEPSNPWQAGVCNLFTSEFFKICKDRLNPAGVLGLWIQYEEISTQDILRIFAALRTQFKYTIPLASDGCMVVMASNEPIKLNLNEVNKLIATRPIDGHMKKCDIVSGADVLARIVCSSDMVGKLSADIEPNSDDRNYLEFDVGRTYDTKLFQGENEKFLSTNFGTPWEVVDWGSIDAKQKAAVMVEVAVEALRLQCSERAAAWAREAFKTYPDPTALAAEARAEMSMGNTRLGQELFTRALNMAPNSAQIYLARGNQYLVHNQITLARADFQKALQLSAASDEAKYLLAKTYTSAGRAVVLGSTTHQEVFEEQPDQVLKVLGDLPANTKFVEKHPDILLMAGMANLQKNQYPAAKQQLSGYIRQNSGSVLAWRGLGAIYFAQGDQLPAAACWQRSFVNGSKRAVIEVRQARKMIMDGKIDNAATVLRHALEYAPGNREALALVSQIAPENEQALRLARELGIPVRQRAQK